MNLGDDFIFILVIAILDVCLVLAGFCLGFICKIPNEYFSNKYKPKDSKIIDINETRAIVDDEEYITTTITSKRKIEK